MVCQSLLQWTTFCQTSPPSPSCLGGPQAAWLSFTELDKAVVCVIRLTNFLWLWFQCDCLLMLSHNTYHFTLTSLTLDVGYIFTAAPAKRSCCSLPWMRVSPHSRLSWPWTWSSSSLPSCTCALLERGVVPLACLVWPLKCVAPLSHSCADPAWHALSLPLTLGEV